MRSTSTGGPYQEVGTGGPASFTDTGLSNGTTYYYVVVAENAGGKSGFSNQASATPISLPLAPPTNLIASTGKGKQRIEITWKQSPSSGVTKNRVYRSTTKAGGYTLRATLSASTSFSDTNVASKTTYYYVVTAVNSKGKESVYSNQASAAAR
jgi:cellulose 1,4-beta-cellobiosidase